MRFVPKQTKAFKYVYYEIWLPFSYCQPLHKDVRRSSCLYINLKGATLLPRNTNSEALLYTMASKVVMNFRHGNLITGSPYHQRVLADHALNSLEARSFQKLKSSFRVIESSRLLDYTQYLKPI